MYYANCEWYVGMGEHNKPLCEKKGYRPANCSECPVYIESIEEENAKLRELVYDMLQDEERGHNDDGTFSEHVSRAHEYGIAQDIEV